MKILSKKESLELRLKNLRHSHNEISSGRQTVHGKEKEALAQLEEEIEIIEMELVENA